MSLISKKSLLDRVHRGKDARNRLVENNLAEGIAFQIGATRAKRGWTQGRLAIEVGGMTQNNISRLESPDYGKYSLASLLRIASAFDVALEVRFVPFSSYIDWLSGTPRTEEGISPEAMAVPSFEDENRSGKFSPQTPIKKVEAIPSIAVSPSGVNFYATPGFTATYHILGTLGVASGSDWLPSTSDDVNNEMVVR